jgi:hypothetical protein
MHLNSTARHLNTLEIRDSVREDVHILRVTRDSQSCTRYHACSSNRIEIIDVDVASAVNVKYSRLANFSVACSGASCDQLVKNNVQLQ